MSTVNNPRDEQFTQRVAESFDRQAFMKLLGVELVSVEPGICELRLPFRPELTQQHGYFHAGVVSTLADNAAGYAAYSLMGSDSSVLTVEFKLNLMAPANGSTLFARAEVLKSGRTLTICRADVFSEQDGKSTLCAAAQSTLIELRGQSDSPDRS